MPDPRDPNHPHHRLGYAPKLPTSRSYEWKFALWIVAGTCLGLLLVWTAMAAFDR